jgi:hypothetical protein
MWRCLPPDSESTGKYLAIREVGDGVVVADVDVFVRYENSSTELSPATDSSKQKEKRCRMRLSCESDVSRRGEFPAGIEESEY